MILELGFGLFLLGGIDFIYRGKFNENILPSFFLLMSILMFHYNNIYIDIINFTFMFFSFFIHKKKEEKVMLFHRFIWEHTKLGYIDITILLYLFILSIFNIFYFPFMSLFTLISILLSLFITIIVAYITQKKQYYMTYLAITYLSLLFLFILVIL